MYSRLQAHIGLRQTKCVANLLMNFRLTNYVDVKFVKARRTPRLFHDDRS